MPLLYNSPFARSPVLAVLVRDENLNRLGATGCVTKLSMSATGRVDENADEEDFGDGYC